MGAWRSRAGETCFTASAAASQAVGRFCKPSAQQMVCKTVLPPPLIVANSSAFFAKKKENGRNALGGQPAWVPIVLGTCLIFQCDGQGQFVQEKNKKSEFRAARKYLARFFH
jgi:hypothetical protein